MSPEAYGIIAITAVIAIIGWFIRDKFATMNGEITARKTEIIALQVLVQEHALRLATTDATDKADNKILERIEGTIERQDASIEKLAGEVSKLTGVVEGAFRKLSGGYSAIKDSR
jgi:hypothetical protein